ncbi:MAG: glycosyltransferase family 4 protein [Tepidisphaeraceae bacterium]
MKRILLITSVLPWPLRRNGGAQRTALLRDALARHGRVDILAVGGSTLRESTPEFDRQLAEQNVVGCVVRQPVQEKTPWYLPGPLGSVRRVVRQYVSHYEADPQASTLLDQLMQTNCYELVVSRYLQPAMQCGLARYANVPSVLDFDDIDWLTLAAQISAKPWGGITGPRASRRVLAEVTAVGELALQKFNAVFVTSEEDARQIPRDSTVLPNIPFTDRPDGWLEPLAPAEPSEELLFVGDLQFPPNREGLDRFLTRVWPAVRQQRPRAVLSIVGRGLADADRSRWAQVAGVNVIGFAPDLQECYRRCAMTVVPIYFGGGTKIKVLESLAYGRMVVTTPEAMRGYASLEAEAAVAVAGSDADFAAHVVRLLNDAPLRAAMAGRGRALVEQAFSPDRFQRVVDQTLQNLEST